MYKRNSQSITKAILIFRIFPWAAIILMSKSRIFAQKTAIFFYNDVYRVNLPNNHRFPMQKYYLVRSALQQELCNRTDVDFIVSPMATKDELETTHCPEYISRFVSGKLNSDENRRIGFPWSLSGVQRSTSSVGGTVAAMRSLCRNECLISGHFAGGTHHAFYDYGEGYCVFSDIAVAANLALNEFPNHINQILIIDCDVHQGNGNAVLFQNNPNVFTFSIHCKENYFSKKQLSNLDVEVPAGASDEEYMTLLQNIIPSLVQDIKPQLIFYQSGVDIHHLDRLGKLKVSLDGLSERNKLIYRTAKENEAKVVITMGGG